MKVGFAMQKPNMSRRAGRSGASMALGINRTPLYADRPARARPKQTCDEIAGLAKVNLMGGTSSLCHSLLPDCYVILVVVAINQFVAIEPDERPKVSVEETIAFDRDQRDGETRYRIV